MELDEKFKNGSFRELYLNGDITIDKINDYIDYWHDTTDLPDDLSLMTFLGLKQSEYNVYANHGELALKNYLEKAKYFL